MEEKKVAEQKPQVPVQTRSRKWILGLIGGMFFVLVALVIFLPQPYYTEGFKTLSELQEYAKTIDEDIKMENDSAFFPSYESYYKKNFGPSWWLTIKEKIFGLLYRFGLINRPLFSSSFFKTLLLDVTKERQRRGWVGDFVQKIEVQPDSKIVVVGVVQGSFHPLVRYLEKLKELSIIDENLMLKNQNYYIVFLGNVVNRSPYTLEILSIVLRLLQQNPNNIIYLKNTNEYYEYWKQHTLYRELELRIKPLFFNQQQLVVQEVQSFFNTLPLTLYCTVPFIEITNNKLGCFKCAPCILENEKNELLNDSYFDFFLRTKFKNKIDSCFVSQVSEIPKNYTERTKLLAIIKDIRKRDAYESMKGLRLLDPIKGVSAWTVLSTSAIPYRHGLGYFYDAFAIINPAIKLQDWKIILYNRDIREKEKTFNEEVFPFF